MRYRLRLLTGAGRTLGTIPFDSSDDNNAIATAARHATEGPLELWAQRDDASRMLYRSKARQPERQMVLESEPV
jgi:hypothetical protein